MIPLASSTRLHRCSDHYYLLKAYFVMLDFKNGKKLMNGRTDDMGEYYYHYRPRGSIILYLKHKLTFFVHGERKLENFRRGRKC